MEYFNYKSLFHLASVLVFKSGNWPLFNFPNFAYVWNELKTFYSYRPLSLKSRRNDADNMVIRN